MGRSSLAALLAAVSLVAACGGSEETEATPTRTAVAAPGARPAPPADRSCSRADAGAAYRVCWAPGPQARPSTIERRSGGSWVVLARAPGRPSGGVWHGRWTEVFLSPDRRTLLAQWSGECEIPTAFFLAARGGELRTVTGERYGEAPESLARGWRADGRAEVELWEGLCGRGARKPGVYLIDPESGEATFVRPLKRRSS